MIKVTITDAVEKDRESLHAALAHLGPIDIVPSMRGPEEIPGELVLTLHPQPGETGVGVTADAFRIAAIAAVRNAPRTVLRVPFDVEVFRRALAKSARGKALTPEEATALDRAEEA